MPEFGIALPNWKPPPRPGRVVLTGRHVSVEPLSAEAHAEGLWQAFDGADQVWDYMPYGPFASRDLYRAWLASVETSADPLFYAIRALEATGEKAAGLGGVASFMRIAPEAGSIEIGHINLSPRLRQTRAAAEAMYLMMRWAFDAGYRRFEWKCDALNIPSRRAAQRLGLSFEGVFRQATVVKGRNRDTAWFAATDGDWKGLQGGFEAWLDTTNFSDEGVQKRSLGPFTAPYRYGSDPALR